MMDDKTRARFTHSLPEGQRKIFRRMMWNRDMPIANLYRARWTKPKPPREQHMAVGATIYHINHKLRSLGYHIRPGLLRRTYRLCRLPK